MNTTQKKEHTYTPPKFTSADLEKIEETCGLERITEHCCFIYELTADEIGWLHWIGDRYSIAETIRDNLDGNNWHVDTMEVSKALALDSVDRAPCLSEDTQLQRLIWFIGPDEVAG